MAAILNVTVLSMTVLFLDCSFSCCWNFSFSTSWFRWLTVELIAVEAALVAGWLWPISVSFRPDVISCNFFLMLAFFTPLRAESLRAAPVSKRAPASLLAALDDETACCRPAEVVICAAMEEESGKSLTTAAACLHVIHTLLTAERRLTSLTSQLQARGAMPSRPPVPSLSLAPMGRKRNKQWSLFRGSSNLRVIRGGDVRGAKRDKRRRCERG